jgi:NADP-dependent 3-hydroxy acid dehydrogenase YdfG
MENKVIAITGASSGIGEATALLLAQHGLKLVLGARREDKLAALAEKIRNAGGEVSYIRTDVTQQQDVENLVNFAIEKYGRLDVLLSNAGIAPISPLDALKVDDWMEMIDVNLKGFLFGIAAALPVFRKQGIGHFIQTISTAGIQIVPTMAVYAGTKNAVRTIAEALRQEVGAMIRVTNVSPGFVNTNLADSMTDMSIKESMRSRMDNIAMPPAAIARAILFAIEQPHEVDVNDIVIRSVAQ